MGKTGYTKCIEFMKFLKGRGYENEISLDDMIKLIKLYFGNDRRTVVKYTDALFEFKFIERINLKVFKIKEVYEKLF